MSSGFDSSAISSLGVGSGLNLSSLLDKLQQADQQQLNPLRAQERSFKTKLSAYGKLQDAVKGVQNAADKLNDASLFRGKKVSTDSQAFSATTDNDAVTGNYRVKVNQLARAQSLVADGQASETAEIGSGGSIHLSLGDGSGQASKSVDLALGDGENTLDGIRNAVNIADIGVTASIINDGSSNPYRLVLSSDKTGTDSQISVSVSGNSALSGVLDYDSSNKSAPSNALTQSVTAGNAKAEVNGIAIESQSNTVEDAIQGVTLSLSSTNDSAEQLGTTRDTGAVENAINKFVKSYNQLQSVSGKLTAFNGSKKTDSNGVLLGDSTARSVETRLHSALNTPVTSGAFSGLAQIGVSLQKDGTLSVDQQKLDDALGNHLDDVQAVLSGKGDVKGVAGLVSDTASRLAGDNGLLQTATDSTQTSIDRTETRINRKQDQLDASIARQRDEFERLDATVAKLNSTQQYLSRQLSQLGGGGSSRDSNSGGLF